MKVCFIGNTRSYKTSVATYIWSGVLGYHRPTINYQAFLYKEHIIYDCGCTRYNTSIYPPYEDIDLFVLFIESASRESSKLDVPATIIYDFIRKINKSAKIVGVVSPSCLEECVGIAESIRALLI